MITIKFNGAAKTVTGSCYLVKTQNAKFLVDCGMFQGPDVESKNLEDFEFNPKEIDFVLLTHAHMDHAGMLPKLIGHGFNGPIFATNNTIQISNLLLLDSAKIQEENFQKGMPYGKFTKTVGYAYNTSDVLKTTELLTSVSFDQEFSPKNSIKIKYLEAGHILGAASIEIDIEDEGKTKKIIFSGDIGRKNSKLINTFDKDYKSNPDFVIMESLYGGEYHPPRPDSVSDLISIINETTYRGGNSYIPSFAVERTQEIVNDLKLAYESDFLNHTTSVWLDSPLAQKVTRIYTEALQTTENNLFDFPSFKYVNKFRRSLKIAKNQKQVIIAGSGMADGGRILMHLATGLSDKRNSVIFVGFQAEGTLGRELADGAKTVFIGDQKVIVKAQIHHLHGFSAHGDTSDYLYWLERFKNEDLKTVFLVHAEEERAQALNSILNDKGYNTYIPSLKEEVRI